MPTTKTQEIYRQPEQDPYDNLPETSTQEVLDLSLSHQLPSGAQSSPAPLPPPYSITDQVSAPPPPPAPVDIHNSFMVSLDTQNRPTNSTSYGGSSSDVHVTAINTRTARDKSVATAYCLAVPLGFLGAHHFYLGRPRFGILYMLTFGLFGLGWLTDICRLPVLVKRCNSRRKDPASYFQGPEDRDTFYVYVMWLPFGFIGAHHYYLRRWKWAVLYTFTAGLFGIGWIVDAFRIPKLTRDTNRKLAEARSRTQARGPQRKKLGSAYLLWIPPLGIFGAHHYYLGRTRFGVLYTLTGGLFFVGWIADCIRMTWLVDRINDQLEQDFKKASEGKLVTRDKTRYVDDAYVLHCGPFGLLGAAQFYLGRYCWAVAYFFTFGFFGIGWIYDMFRMKHHVKTANDKLEGNDRIQIQYGPNTQIIVVTDGRVVSGGQPGAAQPVVIPSLGITGAQPQFPVDQPPSYDSVVTEAEGATGGHVAPEASAAVHRSSNSTSTPDISTSHTAPGPVKSSSSDRGAPNPGYNTSLSQDDTSCPTKKYPPEDIRH